MRAMMIFLFGQALLLALKSLESPERQNSQKQLGIRSEGRSSLKRIVLAENGRPEFRTPKMGFVLHLHSGPLPDGQDAVTTDAFKFYMPLDPYLEVHA